MFDVYISPDNIILKSQLRVRLMFNVYIIPYNIILKSQLRVSCMSTSSYSKELEIALTKRKELSIIANCAYT